MKVKNSPRGRLAGPTASDRSQRSPKPSRSRADLAPPNKEPTRRLSFASHRLREASLSRWFRSGGKSWQPVGLGSFLVVRGKPHARGGCLWPRKRFFPRGAGSLPGVHGRLRVRGGYLAAEKGDFLTARGRFPSPTGGFAFAAGALCPEKGDFLAARGASRRPRVASRSRRVPLRPEKEHFSRRGALFVVRGRPCVRGG